MSAHDDLPDPISAWIEASAPAGEDLASARARLAAEVGAALDAFSFAGHASVDAERMAAWIDGGLSSEEAVDLVLRPGEMARAEAAADFLEESAAFVEAPPDALRSATRALLTVAASGKPNAGADIIKLRLPASATASKVETVYLMAAASDPADPSVVCRSESGVWVLRSFAGTSSSDREAGRGDLLLTIHPDHAAAYEGRSVRVFVIIGGEERVLAEDVIRAGTLFVPTSLTGLDLRKRDAINVVFGPPAEDGAAAHGDENVP